MKRIERIMKEYGKDDGVNTQQPRYRARFRLSSRNSRVPACANYACGHKIYGNNIIFNICETYIR